MTGRNSSTNKPRWPLITTASTATRRLDSRKLLNFPVASLKVDLPLPQAPNRPPCHRQSSCALCRAHRIQRIQSYPSSGAIADLQNVPLLRQHSSFSIWSHAIRMTVVSFANGLKRPARTLASTLALLKITAAHHLQVAAYRTISRVTRQPDTFKLLCES